MSVLERCPSYRESNKGNKERQGPTLGVRYTEVSVKRESTVKVIPHIKEPLLHFDCNIFNEYLFGPQISSWSQLIILAVAKCVAFQRCMKHKVTDRYK